MVEQEREARENSRCRSLSHVLEELQLVVDRNFYIDPAFQLCNNIPQKQSSATQTSLHHKGWTQSLVEYTSEPRLNVYNDEFNR